MGVNNYALISPVILAQLQWCKYPRLIAHLAITRASSGFIGEPEIPDALLHQFQVEL